MELKMRPNIKEMKEIIYGIIEEEKRNYHINISASPITIVEYYKTNTFQKKIKLKKPINNLVQLMNPINNMGWYNDRDQNIFIILNHYQEKSKITTLVDLISTGYHESRHRFQDKAITWTDEYEFFLIKIEQIILHTSLGCYYYKNNHDSFMLEIDANIDSINKTKKYLKKYPDIYKEIQEYLEEKSQQYQYDYFNYNPQKKIEILDIVMKEQPGTILNKYPTLGMFYHLDGTFKSISAILDNKELDSLDPRIINLVLSSKTFVEQIDLEKLSIKEKNYMINILSDIYQKEIKRQQIGQYYAKSQKKLKFEILEKKGLLDTIKYLNKTLSKLLYQPVAKKDALTTKAYYDKIESILTENSLENNRKRN